MAWIRATALAFITFVLVGFSVATTAQGNTPSNLSPEQIERFQQLPPAQQRLIARQYGIDIEQLNQQSRQNQKQQDEQAANIFPRGTEFDREGNPILPDNLKQYFEDEESEIKRFGADLFASEPRDYSALNNIPVPAHYVLGAGDTIEVKLYGKEERSETLTVDSEGQIIMSQVGPIQVAGMTFDEARDVIKAKVKERMIGVDAAISLGELRSIQVFVVGEAYRPGSYTVSSLATITQALVAAGGVSEIGSLRHISLKRNGELVTTFDLYDLLINGDATNDVTLQPGDVVLIPPVDDLVTIKGEVVRPAIYELKDERTLEETLALAGGVRASAYEEQVIIERVKSGDKRMITANLNSEGDELEVIDGDTIEVLPTGGRPSNSITLVGAVSRPGRYAYRPEMRVNDLIASVNRDLLPNADLNYGIIVRETNVRRDIEVLQFDVAEAISATSDSPENILLKPDDFVLIFSRFELASDESVTIDTLAMSEDDRKAEERKQLLEEYEQYFLQQLTVDQDKNELDVLKAQREQRAELDSLFVQSGDEEDEEEQEYAEYSRQNLLQPVLVKLRGQGRLGSTAQLVFVDGEVRYPGIYPLPKNASVEKLITAAGGLKESAYLERAEISRVIVDGGDEADVQYENFDLKAAIAGEISPELKGRDRLNILTIPQWQESYQVEISGEVRFPGTYSIRRGDTLSALIERAGGLTAYAAPEGAVFTRELLKEQESQRMRRLARNLQQEVITNSITNTSQANNVSYSELRTILTDLTSVEAVGRMVIDLPGILSNRAQNDLQLRDGDYLHIPTEQTSVSVIGEVQFASAHRFRGDLTVEDYISLSGGLKGKADDERIYIIKSDGSVQIPKSSWFSVSNTQLQPGDTIVVPLDSQYIDNLNLWTQATQIIYQISVAVAAISGL